MSGCSRYKRFSDPSGFSAEVPRDWTRGGDVDLNRQPVASLNWVGAQVGQDAGLPIGAVIGVTRLSRKSGGMDEGAWRRYRADWLDRSDQLFAGAQGNQASFRQDFEMSDKLHGEKSLPMRLEDVVIRTPDFYWVLDYRATKELFDKYYPAFQRFSASARVAR